MQHRYQFIRAGGNLRRTACGLAAACIVAELLLEELKVTRTFILGLRHLQFFRRRSQRQRFIEPYTNTGSSFANETVFSGRNS